MMVKKVEPTEVLEAKIRAARQLGSTMIFFDYVPY